MSSGKAKRRVQNRTRLTSNVFAMFNQSQIAEFKEAFMYIDDPHDNVIDESDLRKCMGSFGKEPDEGTISEMLDEAKGQLNFTMFLTLFGSKMTGCDPEETILSAFSCFDTEDSGKIEENRLRHLLTTMGDRWSDEDVNKLFQYAPITDGVLDYQDFTKLMTRGQDEDGDTC